MFEEKIGYNYIPHTADAKFEAFGKDITEAFKNAAFATYNIIVDTDLVKPVIKKTIIIKAKRDFSLLYDFLEEFLFFLDTENFLLSTIESLEIFEENEELVLNCVCFGDSIFDEDKIRKYEVEGNVKSVTYNDMSIEKRDDKVYVTVVIDL